jgi:hypothetical protein
MCISKISLIVEFENKTIEREEAFHWLVPKNVNDFIQLQGIIS